MKPYEGLAPYYDLLYEREVGVDYAAEDARLTEEIRRRVPGAKTLLEVACGTGAHLRHLRHEFDVEGMDLSPEMLKVARRRVRGVPLHQGDFLDFRPTRQFDVVVCLFSSIAYVKSLPRLRRAVRNLAEQLTPGGLLVMDGWIRPADFRPGFVGVQTVSDEEVTLVRLNRSSRRGRVSVLDWHFLLARGGRVAYFQERHEVGLFESHEYVAALEEAGLHVEVEPDGAVHGRDRYFGVKPTATHQEPPIRRGRPPGS